MTDENRSASSAGIARLLAFLINPSLLEALAEAWKLGRKVLRGLANEGMYEVLEYESTLELRDKHGEHALVHKREKVRYLQNHIIAYQDEAWADGEILLNYRCTPGTPVDRYQPGRKTYILISLREVRNRGDVDVFNIEWGIKGGFVRSTELWETEINHRTRRLKVQLIFPEARVPLRASVVESTRQRTHSLGEDAQTQLPDGRWLITWETSRPRFHERYLLKWEW